VPYLSASDSLSRLTKRGTLVALLVEPRICSLEASSFMPQDLQDALLRIPCTNLQWGHRTTLNDLRRGVGLGVRRGNISHPFGTYGL